MSASASTPFDLLVYSFNKLLPFWLPEKVLLLLAFFLMGLGAHRLLSHYGIGAYFAGILYMINPFTYVRFMAGQWGVLWSYALTPFAIKAFLQLLEKPSAKGAIKVAFLFTLVGLLQVHGFFLVFLASFVFYVLKMVAERYEQADMLHISKYVGTSAGLFLALNLYWGVPTLIAEETILDQIGQIDLFLFAPQSTSRILLDLASMQGFWRLAYVYVQQIVSFWWLFFSFLLLLVVYGLISGLKIKRLQWIVLSLATTGVVSFFLAAGTVITPTRSLCELLWEHIPLARAFRDSHKFIGLLCFSYAYLGGIGVNKIAGDIKRHSKKFAKIVLMAIVFMALAMPIAYSFPTFGSQEQLRVTHYPKEWQEVNEFLNKDLADFSMLFLPWHQYMDFSWLPNREKRLSNPARAFFTKPVIQGDAHEMPGSYSQSTNAVSKYIEFLLSKANNVDNFAELLAPLNVKYVVLVNEADYMMYDFLYRQNDLKVELQKPGITLFKNEYQTAKVYSVENVEYIKDLEMYLELSQIQDVMSHTYVVKEGPSESGIEQQMQEIHLEEKTPVKYKVGGTSQKYTIFTVPQNVNTNSWEYNGQDPVMYNLGIMPVFASSPKGGEIIYKRFYRVDLPSYMVSGTALVVILIIFFGKTKWRSLFRRGNSKNSSIKTD